MQIEITFPDGRKQNYEKGISSMDIAKSISEGLARNVLSAMVNGEVIDASRPIHTDATLQLLTWNDKQGKSTYWHSSAHLMAEALEALFPGTRFGIGPAIDNGFYYDVDPGEHTLTASDLVKIESKILELAKNKSTFERKEISKRCNLLFYRKNDPYKLELLQDLQDGQITFYTQGQFTDLCKGPHIPDTSTIKAVKLLNIAGAYWRGDETRPQLTRIYGITFPKQKN